MNDAEYLNNDRAVDLSNCDREPIHLLGHIQPFGCFIALRFDWIVAFCSANTQDYFGVGPDAVIGTPLKQWIDHQLLHDIRSGYQAATITGRNERMFSRRIESSGRAVDISIHHNGKYIIVEFEQIPAERSSEDSFVRALLSQFYRATDSQHLLEDTAQQLQLISGYDRVMIYRFLADGAGEVVAESTVAGVEPFLGLRYPASDIPRQARALYLKNLLRVIHNVDAPTVEIAPGVGPREEPMDLSFSTLRAVSPIHIQYLQNMGVAASLSISLIVNGKLWGLIACHHYSPKIPSYFMRTELELFAEIFALELSSRLAREREEESHRLRAVHDKVLATMGSDGKLLDVLFNQFTTMRKLFRCDGVAAVVDGRQRTEGRCLPDELLPQILRFLNRLPASEVSVIHCLEEEMPGYNTQAYKVAGLLAIPISKSPRDYLLFYRDAHSQTVNWAGNPDKPVDTSKGGSRLLPRASFALWQQTHDDRCEPWSEQDYRSGESLRITLLEVVIRNFQERDDIQRKASRTHEVLISELNHRVRNILNLVNAIVAQTEQTGRDLHEFVNVLTGRIMALASAHDQLTASRWTAISFGQLLNTEIQAYASGCGDIDHGGPEVLLKPDATTPLVLVVHELFTNAAKYGALSTSGKNGKVSIVWEVDEDRGLTIDWTESGGPPVSPPGRNGFGMTLIDSIIPHELGGEVTVNFAPGGLQAKLRVPVRFIDMPDVADILDADTASAPAQIKWSLPDSALIIEDNLVIALDLQKKLLANGIKDVMIAGSVARANASLASRTPQIIISDVHLGSDTTFSLIEKAIDDSILCIIVSGYGEELSVPDSLKDVPLLTKPVSDKLLLQTLHSQWMSADALQQKK